MKAPDNALALENYRGLAPAYDEATWMMEPLRRRAVDALRLEPGDVVLDVACGTGKSFALIQEQIGPAGRLIAIDQSPEMLAIARRRVARAGWRNVTLVESAVERARIAEEVDAILFCYAHDVLQSDIALDSVFATARRGCRVASTGMQCFPWWLEPLNLIVWAKARRYATALAGFHRPWRRLRRRVADFALDSAYLGMAYLARGTYALPGGAAEVAR